MAADMTLTCDRVRDLAPAYVLGALERAEELAVGEHLRSCSDAHEEMAELGAVVPYLNDTVPLVEPPASLRGRILSAAAAELADRPAAPAPVRPRPASPAVERQADAGTAGTDRVVSLEEARARRRPGLGTWAVGIAAVLAIVALGAWNVVLQRDLSGARDYQARVAAVLALAQQPGSQVAILTSAAGPGPGPGGMGVMPASGPGRLVVSGLKPTTGSQVYEIWAIAEGQPPVPVGWFTADESGVGYFDRLPAAVGQTITVALTLENTPDPPAPTGPVLASGIAVMNS